MPKRPQIQSFRLREGEKGVTIWVSVTIWDVTIISADSIYSYLVLLNQEYQQICPHKWQSKRGIKNRLT